MKIKYIQKNKCSVCELEFNISYTILNMEWIFIKIYYFQVTKWPM